MAGTMVTRCRACGAPLERGHRVRVQTLSEHEEGGVVVTSVDSSMLVCPTCAWAVGELLRRMGGDR